MMKKISVTLSLISVIGLASLWLLLACERPVIHTDVQVSNSELSSCHTGEKDGESDPVFSYSHGVLHVTHEMLLNCAASNVDVNAQIAGNDIVINYSVDDNISADCLCSKTLKYTLHNIRSGTYTITINIDGTFWYQNTLTF